MSDSIKTTTDGTLIQIDACELVNSLDDKSRNLIAKELAVEDKCFEAIVEVLTENFFFYEEEGRGWWALDERRVEALRLKLLPLMDDVAVQLIKHLVRDRDASELKANQAERRYWKLHHAWPDDRYRDKPDLRDDEGYVAPDWVEDDEAREILKGMREAMKKGEVATDGK